MKKDNLEVLFDEEAIAKRVDALAKEITMDYQGKDLLVIAILKGSFIFAADLVRQIDLPLEMDFQKPLYRCLRLFTRPSRKAGQGKLIRILPGEQESPGSARACWKVSELAVPGSM